MESHRTDYRWGIPALDSGFTMIPNFVLRHYAEVGVSRPEFLFILHLASYKFDSPKGQASPALETIAAQMDYKVRQVQRIRASLEEKGMLKVWERPGTTSVYDFQGLALACLELEKKETSNDTGVTQDTPGVSPRTPLGVSPRTPEEQEEKKKKQQQQTAAASSSESVREKSADAAAAVSAAAAASLQSAGGEIGELEKLGISEIMATQLVEEHGPEQVRSVLERLRQSPEAVRKPSGWVIAALRGRYVPLGPPAGGGGSALLQGQRGRCTFKRNPSLGECPSEEYGEPAYPWCRGCERGG